MTDTATTAPKPEAAPLTVVLKKSADGFAPRTRKSTADALASLTPSLDAVKGAPDDVYTIVEGVTPARAASLVSLLNERYPRSWTFGGRTAADGKTAIVQARYSEKPELARPVRKSTPRATTATTNGTGSGSGEKGKPRK